MKNGEVSIIIPIYNSELYLSETLDSVLKQTYSGWRCLLVNDGSSDNSQSIIDEYCKKDNRFQSLSKDNEGSPDLARKYGMQFVETEWVLWLDSDDVIEPSYIEKLFKRQQETNADYVGAVMVVCKQGVEGEVYRFPEPHFDMTSILSGRDAFKLTIAGWEITTWGMFKKSLWNNIINGGYINSDEFTSRQILYNANIVAFTNAMYYYRNNANSISRAKSVNFYKNLHVQKQVEDFVFAHYPNDEDLQTKAVKYNFFNLIAWMSEAIINRKQYTKAERKLINNWLKLAYEEINFACVKQHFPSHYKLFCHGYRWFKITSALYMFAKRSKCKK